MKQSTVSSYIGSEHPEFAKADPISNVFWVPAALLYANDYNPNHQAPIERELLKCSIMEDRWTAPCHIREDGEIVDGFHRWHLAENDPELLERYHGFVPCTLAPAGKSRAEQMLATIRHNRARGEHGVRPMALIVRELMDVQGLTTKDLVDRLGMEEEEVERLYDAAGSPEKTGSLQEGFKKAWVPGDQLAVIKKGT